MLKWPKQKTGCYVHFSATEKKRKKEFEPGYFAMIEGEKRERNKVQCLRRFRPK